ncbi:hypothetical protein [Deinococcus sp. Marseille-Q6407]|uniref:hypothetical protein n=1 Tax=Deinococcus sp. Marseille-Q6407 TaxID=2969223 RepID=UPI0021C079FA|nr:hypothetical protein [Deinococcus sp. Marseille-Q6407]
MTMGRCERISVNGLSGNLDQFNLDFIADETFGFQGVGTLLVTCRKGERVLGAGWLDIGEQTPAAFSLGEYGSRATYSASIGTLPTPSY